MVYGFVSSTLEDLARYALIYTPSRKVVSDESIVSPEMLERIRHSGSESAYQKGDFSDHQWAKECFGASGLPIYNSWQWDAVFADGAMFKHGNMMQGIYVHPERDFVASTFQPTPSIWIPTSSLGTSGQSPTVTLAGNTKRDLDPPSRQRLPRTVRDRTRRSCSPARRSLAGATAAVARAVRRNADTSSIAAGSA